MLVFDTRSSPAPKKQIKCFFGALKPCYCNGRLAENKRNKKKKLKKKRKSPGQNVSPVCLFVLVSILVLLLVVVGGEENGSIRCDNNNDTNNTISKAT